MAKAAFQQFKLKRDISFQETKVNEAYSFFDRNHDGKVDKKDLKEFFKLMGQELDDYDAKKMIEIMDPDGKDMDLTSFMQLLSYGMNDRNQDRDLDIAFRAIDTNKQGYLDASQLKQFLAQLNEEISLEEAEQVKKSFSIKITVIMTPLTFLSR